MNDARDRDSSRTVPLPGSRRDAGVGAEPGPHPLLADEGLEVTIVLRRRSGAATGSDVGSGTSSGPSGADPADIARVTSILEAAGLQIVGTHPLSRRMRVAGTVAAMEQVFATSLSSVVSRGPDGEQHQHRQRLGSLSIPAELDGIVTAVLGLDDRPQARAQFRPAATAAISYTPLELGAVYDFPASTDGTGQTIAIIELGGGFGESDLTAYFD